MKRIACTIERVGMLINTNMAGRAEVMLRDMGRGGRVEV